MSALLSGAVAAIGSSVLGGLFGRNNSKRQSADSRYASELANQDQRITTADEEFFKQLQETLSSMDKNIMEQIFGTSNTNEIMTAMQDVQTQQSTQQTQQTQQQTQRGDAASQAALQQAIQQTGAGGPDANAAMQAAMNQVLRSGMPAITNVGARSGTFNSTTEALLQNDLITQAAERGAQLQLGQQNQNQANLAQLLGIAQQGTETTTGSMTMQQQMQELMNMLQQQQNQSSTETAQNRQAQEQSTEKSQTSTEGSRTNTSDQFVDMSKDNGFNKNMFAGTALGDALGVPRPQPAPPSNSAGGWEVAPIDPSNPGAPGSPAPGYRVPTDLERMLQGVLPSAGGGGMPGVPGVSVLPDMSILPVDSVVRGQIV